MQTTLQKECWREQCRLGFRSEAMRNSFKGLKGLQSATSTKPGLPACTQVGGQDVLSARVLQHWRRAGLGPADFYTAQSLPHKSKSTAAFFSLCHLEWSPTCSVTNEVLVLTCFPTGHGADVKCVDWHPTKGLVVSVSKDSQQPIKFWDPKTGQSLATL